MSPIVPAGSDRNTGQRLNRRARHVLRQTAAMTTDSTATDLPPTSDPPATSDLPATAVSFGRRVTDLATEHPDGIAVIFATLGGDDLTLTWGELDRASNRAARALAERGVGPTSMVVIALPNCLEHLIATYGCWKVGACVVPLRWDLPDWERDRVLNVVEPSIAIAEWSSPPAGVSVLDRTTVQAQEHSEATLPDIVANPPKAMATSGSTGTPKIILSQLPGSGTPGASMHSPSAVYLRHRPGQVQLVAAPLYHTNGFQLGHNALFEGQSLVLMERFEPSRAVELIERYRVNTMTMVTIMLQRIARLPDVATRDFSSLESVLHGGAPLPHWVAQAWIDLIGPERFVVAYGSSEVAGVTLGRGHDLLARPGTVGKPFLSEFRIFDADGNDVPTGEVGEIYMRWIGQTAPSFSYRGGEARTRPDLFSSMGDLGWLDADGYLFLADRRTDLIISGGANIYAAEIEAALTEHASVADAVVVGLPDAEWGQAVHAVIEVAASLAAPTSEELRAHCQSRLAGYKVPKTFEFVERLKRSDAGKVRRADYAAPTKS